MNCILIFLLTLISLLPLCLTYSRSDTYRCNADETSTRPESLYTCKGHQSSCRAFLIFSAVPPYNTVPSIANLTSSDGDEIARVNNVTTLELLPAGREVIVPVNCSCSGRSSYQASTTYQILSYETYFIIANKTFQGLSTCYALKHANEYPETALLPGQTLRVPLTCACPTTEQAAVGTRFLLTYSAGFGDTLGALGKRFNASITSMLEANEYSFLNDLTEIQPFTTVLVPLQGEPSHSRAISTKYNVSTASPPLSSSTPLRNRPNRVRLIVGVTTGAFVLLMLLLLGLLFLYHKRRAQQRGVNTKVSSPQDLILEIARLDRALKAYKFSDIKKATRNFGCKNRIKEHEYRGTFKSAVLAVKRISGNAEHEIKMMYKINHINIVRLQGFCQDKHDSYLVYEYMANGCLRSWLDRRESSHDMKSWNQRIRIALDVANGLLYLHSFTNPAYVHNDVTSSNVLLDANLRAKIANFSLAREANCGAVERVVGSKGYMAPECLDAGPVTPKADVYAFGVVLLELITYKCPVFEEDGRGRLLSTMVAAVMESPNAGSELCRFVGPGLAENGGTKYAIQMVKLSLSCLMQEPQERPDMVEVVSILLKMYSVVHKPL